MSSWMFRSIRIFLVIAAFHDYEVWNMDVKVMFNPRGFIIDTKYPKRVGKLPIVGINGFIM